MSENNSYVHRDEHNVLRVGKSRVMLDSVLAAWEHGHSPETIRAQYPSLTLEEVYGAITWCLSHADEAAEYMKRQNATWMHWRNRSESTGDALRDRLRTAKTFVQPQGPA